MCGNELSRQWASENPEKVRVAVERLREKDHAKTILTSAKRRAKLAGIPFSLSYLDIIIPDRCPVLGIPLERGNDTSRDTSPSLDKIVPALGYVPGNVKVISMRANRLKSDASAEELAALLNYILANTPKPPKRPRRAYAKPAADPAPLAASTHDQPRQSNP